MFVRKKVITGDPNETHQQKVSNEEHEDDEGGEAIHGCTPAL
jgi:hypothetical protein